MPDIRLIDVSRCENCNIPAEDLSVYGSNKVFRMTFYVIEGRRDKMSVNKSLISGSTAMLILRLLEDKDMYGYEMIETLEKKSNNVFTLKAGTMYPLLHSLEEKNYLTSYESPVNGKLRKYYSITKDGRKYLKSRKEEWQEYQEAVLNVLWVELACEC